MLQDLLAAMWVRIPKKLRRLSMRVTQQRFTVTAGGIVIDDQNRVLLLKHRFRAGSGWGIPGGFLKNEEQPEEALRRELREEVGLELASTTLLAVRTLPRQQQVEVLFRCTARGGVSPTSSEIESAEWFTVDSLPEGFPSSQAELVRYVLSQAGAQ